MPVGSELNEIIYLADLVSFLAELTNHNAATNIYVYDYIYD